MEFATPKPLKPSSNISDIVSKFAKVCKLRSIGVFTSDNQDHHHQHPNNPNNLSAPFGEDGSDVTEDTERDGVKIHPQPMEVTRTSSMCGDAELSKLFDIVSALKLAYIQLQEAHVPYNPKKIVAADGHFMAELESLCQIKRVYKETQCVKPKSDSSHSAILRKKVELNEKLLEELKFQTEVKNSDIICLQQELRDLDLMNVTLAENVRQISLQRKNARVLNITTFQDAYRAASKSIHDFAKPLISLMKASGWDLDLAAKAVEVEAAYSKRSHKKYAFEAYIARRMFYGMSLKAYNVDGIMRYDDPMDALIENPDSDFARFCGEKYLLVVHPMMESWFFGHLDHRTLVLSGKHPRTSFYQIFARMAMRVWVLHGIAPSIDSEAKIFAVKRGSKFSDAYMESVEEDGKGAAVLDEGQVEFMVMPGFRIGETIVRSRVYVSKPKM
ncbi:PREDICTED: IRK-interacting [Prunus dulcis]|uniref:PREDICTED: IRK-interacting n=1 Tax=Prunus dulcis TaxID=3755 RepID=A0A5E4ERF7_PRUDU|nr:protein GRAVITROPIC IN THE LIGHT 1 [Prunus dulcis]XP_034218159.1 protein GRAVITROPIC IN THE LIGHT 1 [Prunus dulcis]VVA16428.1 PREDICTED: IRK-interacting [Prunus dulcis]